MVCLIFLLTSDSGRAHCVKKNSVMQSRFEFSSMLFHEVLVSERSTKHENVFGWPIAVHNCQPKVARPEVRV